MWFDLAIAFVLGLFLGWCIWAEKPPRYVELKDEEETPEDRAWLRQHFAQRPFGSGAVIERNELQQENEREPQEPSEGYGIQA